MPKDICDFAGDFTSIRAKILVMLVKIHKNPLRFCNKMSKATCKMCKRAV